MPVLEVTNMWSRDDGKIASSDGRTFTLSQTDAYQVTVTPDTSRRQIASDIRIPKVGASLVGAPFITVKSVDFDRVSPLLWVVTVNSSGELGNDDPSSTPIDNRLIFKGSTVQSEVEITEDAVGKAITTVNGEPIFGVKKKIYDLSFNLTRNFLAINFDVVSEYLDAVNSDFFLGFAPGRVKFVGYSFEEIAADQFVYYKVTGNFEIRKPYNTTAAKAWHFRTLHQGYKVKDSQGNIVTAVDDNGQDTTSPVLLKSDGTEETNPSNANFLEIQTYSSLPYNNLGFV